MLYVLCRVHVLHPVFGKVKTAKTLTKGLGDTEDINMSCLVL